MKKLRKRWLVLLVIVLLVAAVAVLVFLPALTPSFYDGWPDVTITIVGASPADVVRIRYLEVQQDLVEFYRSLSDEDILDQSREPVETTSTSVTVTVWFGGKRGPLYLTYHQTWGVLLLIPAPNGALHRRVVVLPDLRQSKSATLDVRETRADVLPGP